MVREDVTPAIGRQDPARWRRDSQGIHRRDRNGCDGCVGHGRNWDGLRGNGLNGGGHEGDTMNRLVHFCSALSGPYPVVTLAWYQNKKVHRSVEVQYYLQPLWNILWNTDAPCWKHLLPVPPLLRYDSLSDGSYAVGRCRALHQHRSVHPLLHLPARTVP